MIKNLVDHHEIWIYPFVNPDGRSYFFPYRSNANGVDLNPDWGYMWDEMGSSEGALKILILN